MFICDNGVFFEKFTWYETIFSDEMKTPGPSHQIDELKAPGSLCSKSLKQVSIVLIPAV